jgi:glycosyltransferase involved in cell wall biosynthesis
MAIVERPATTERPGLTVGSEGSNPRLDVSVVVPVRNAESIVEVCLESIVRSRPREVIVVDGKSTDRTVEIAGRYADHILSDEGDGLPVARLLGVRASRSRWVVLVDADVVLPDGALTELLEEFVAGRYTALQAGLRTVSGQGYWGRALAHHHLTGRSKDWLGVMATVLERQAMLEHGFDARFLSGEDIELRWRLERAGLKVGVSRRTTVVHRFADDSFAFAKDQWLADGKGLGRMVRKHGLRGAWLLLLPLLAGIRGVVLSLTVWRQPRWMPYFVLYCFFNYVGIFGVLRRQVATWKPSHRADLLVEGR